MTTDLSARLAAALHDRFTIERELGRGGMAIVFLARDLRLGREVAIKVMRPEIAALVGAERFLREIRIAAGFAHPHILPVHESGEADHIIYYVMPYVAGESLRHRLDREPRLAVEQAVRIAGQVASALACAHDHGVVHRDIKPENILLAVGEAVVTDFGIAKAIGSTTGEGGTQTGLVVGSPTYMSPEQFQGEVDGRTDIYALGCVLYEMLSGAPPFSGPTTLALLARHAAEPVPPLRLVRGTVPIQLEGTVLRALAKRPADRFPTAQAFGDALRGSQSVRAVPQVSEPSTPMARSLAVLPFSDQSPQQDQGYLCEGMAEELLNALAKLEGLRVVARTSAFAFRDRGLDIREIGRHLNATHVLEGSVRSAGDQLRITVVLNSTADGFQLWSERYDRRLADVFEIQDDIARTVAGALKVRLTRPGVVPLVRQGTDDPAAYQAYLRGRHLWNQRTESALDRSVEEIGHAIALDPGYAQAHAGLADSYAMLGIYGARRPDEVMPLALAAADQALVLDPTSAEALTVRGAVRAVYQWQWAAAEADFLRAIETNPRYPTAPHWYATNLLLPLGRFGAARTALETAVALDPGSPAIVASVGFLRYLERGYEEAAREFRQLLKWQPGFGLGHYFLGHTLLALGRSDEAVAALTQAAALSGDSPEILAALGHASATAGHRDQAEAVLQRLADAAAQRFVSPALPALVRLGLGDHEAALDGLEEAAELRTPEMIWLGVRPAYDVLRGGPRFSRLLERLGLPTREREPSAGR